jgi:hypothetical protein
MSSGDHLFVEPTHDRGSDDREVPKSHPTIDPDETISRMKPLSDKQVGKLYGKGYLLLTKAGLREGEELSAPVKVYVRKAREGLQDDDCKGRKVLGEQSEKASSVNHTLDLSAYIGTFPRIVEYISALGGSAHIAEVFRDMVRDKVASPSFTVFKLLLDTDIVKYGLKRLGDEVLLIRPPLTIASSRKACVCQDGRRYFRTLPEWASHVLEELSSYHELYESELMGWSRSGRWFHCLPCNRPMQDLVRVVKHCNAMPDDLHKHFGRVVVISALHSSDEFQRDLLFQAMHDGDSAFPWGSYAGGAADPLEDIPFSESPRTPIHLSDSDSDIAEVVDIIDVDGPSNLIELDED